MPSLIDSNNINLKNTSLSIPTHISWSFNGEMFSSICNKPNSLFEFAYTISNKPVIDLKTAIQETIIDLYTRSNMQLSICISGADSEIIAREAANKGIPFELYFLDIWDINARAREMATSLANELGVILNVLSLSKKEAFDSILIENYKELQAEKPTYLCLPYLLERIPDNTFIIGGEGDPQKSGLEYEILANANGLYNGIPISSTEVYYKQWSLKNHRACEMYFYSSSPLLIKSYFYHPLMIKENKRIDTRTLIDTLWPNLTFGYKTTNWEDSIESNLEIRMFMRSINKNEFRNRPVTCLTKI